MKKYIHIQKEDREFIAKAFKVSKRTVYNAIHFEDMNCTLSNKSAQLGSQLSLGF